MGGNARGEWYLDSWESEEIRRLYYYRAQLLWPAERRRYRSRNGKDVVRSKEAQRQQSRMSDRHRSCVLSRLVECW